MKKSNQEQEYDTFIMMLLYMRNLLYNKCKYKERKRNEGGIVMETACSLKIQFNVLLWFIKGLTVQDN